MEGGDANFVVKYNQLASFVGAESDRPLSHITVISYPYFYSSRGGAHIMLSKNLIFCKCRHMEKGNHTQRVVLFALLFLWQERYPRDGQHMNWVLKRFCLSSIGIKAITIYLPKYHLSGKISDWKKKAARFH